MGLRSETKRRPKEKKLTAALNMVGPKISEKKNKRYWQ